MNTILVVEDESSIREVEVAYLKQAGFSTIEAENGREALDQVLNHKVDLILLDLNLPELDGIQVCKKIREESNLPIIMVTARIDEMDELVGLEVGADDYIKKPFSPTILVARVRRLLERIGGNKTIKAKDIEIDPEKMSIVKGKEEINLTTTQFNILYTLASNPGIVFTREQILDKAYDASIPPDILDRTVDAHIKAIRKKLNDGSNAQEYIQTIIGKGYKFVE